MAAFHLRPKIGFGVSRTAARACAECGLPSACLPEADVIYLWPEDPDVTARLRRLGLTTFGLSRP
jgi:hypothetical protein